MAVFEQDWWRATNIPLVEWDWRNIRLYCDEAVDPFSWSRCVYCIRLAPPWMIAYGCDEADEFLSPVIYFGSGEIRQRWGSHKDWLYDLGHELPGARYEVWVSRPRRQRRSGYYKDVEGEFLSAFHERTGQLPLFNAKFEPFKSTGDGPQIFDLTTRKDRRYLWGIYPSRQSGFWNRYWRGCS